MPPHVSLPASHPVDLAGFNVELDLGPTTSRRSVTKWLCILKGVRRMMRVKARLKHEVSTWHPNTFCVSCSGIKVSIEFHGAGNLLKHEHRLMLELERCSVLVKHMSFHYVDVLIRMIQVSPQMLKLLMMTSASMVKGWRTTKSWGCMSLECKAFGQSILPCTQTCPKNCCHHCRDISGCAMLCCAVGTKSAD